MSSTSTKNHIVVAISTFYEVYSSKGGWRTQPEAINSDPSVIFPSSLPHKNGLPRTLGIPAMMKKAIFTLLSSMLLFGCASTPVLTTSLRMVSIPELERTTTVEIGQTIISKAFVKTTPAILVPNETYDPISKVPIPSGVFPLSREDNAGRYFDSPLKVDRSTWEVIPHVLIYKTIERTVQGKTVGSIGVFVPLDPSKPAVGYIADGSIKGSVPITGIVSTVKEEWSDGSFKRELVYTGIARNIISILYREFNNDIARPAFTQELKYDLSESKIIGYRGSRFEVVSATNTGITYRVLKPLE